MPHVTVNGVRLYYEERGSGTPILGIHGAGSSAVFWEGAAERLSEVGRTIIYDRRGSSRSERPEPYETTSVREHADDLRVLMRALDAEPAILIGRSYGGTIALDLALRHPESVLGAALLEAGTKGLSPSTTSGSRRSTKSSSRRSPDAAWTSWGRSCCAACSARGRSCRMSGATCSRQTAQRSSRKSEEARRPTTLGSAS